MKEISLKPAYLNAWPIPGKIALWKEELRFWKTEGRAFTRLASFSKLVCKKSEKAALERASAELQRFEQEVLPELEANLGALELTLQGRIQDIPGRNVEEMMESSRRRYQKVKAELLPFFSKFLTAGIL